jgi:hypothetical protein
MLLLFSLSITPRKYLHDVFAHHQDTVRLYLKKQSTTIEQKGFQCEQNNQVVEQPFVQTPVPFFAYPLPLVNDYRQDHYNSFIKLFLADQSLRGPPSMA